MITTTQQHEHVKILNLTKEEIEIAKKTKGFLSLEEGLTLYNIAIKASKLGPCLEIGSYCGKSAIYIGYACKQTSGVLFSIDHHKGSEEQQPGQIYFDPDLFDHDISMVNTFNYFKNNILEAGLEDIVLAIVGQSEIIAKNWGTRLSMIFIDGSHAYADVLADYQCWNKHLLPKGYIIFHDIFKDPNQGGQAPYKIYRLAINSGMFIEHKMVGTLGILQAKPTAQIITAND